MQNVIKFHCVCFKPVCVCHLHPQPLQVKFNLSARWQLDVYTSSLRANKHAAAPLLRLPHPFHMLTLNPTRPG